MESKGRTFTREKPMNQDVETVTQPSCKSANIELVQIGGAARSLFWRSPEELRRPQTVRDEFPGGLARGAAKPPENTRRDFLSLMGVTLAAAGLAGCRSPVQNAIPLAVGSDDIIPGVANYYATTCNGCASSCTLVVKQRDGRPIKIEGNARSVLFGNGTCALGQATVLSLYDDARLRGPRWRGQAQSWEEFDRQVLDGLNAGRGSKGKAVLLSGTITSPSTLEIIREWGRSYPAGFRHVVYDPVSLSGLHEAHARSFGR